MPGVRSGLEDCIVVISGSCRQRRATAVRKKVQPLPRFPHILPVRSVTLKTVSTVLVVQSDAALQSGWSAALTESGHDVISAGTVCDGLLRVREGGIDVVVVDTQRDCGALTNFVAELDTLPDPPPFVLVSASPRAPELSTQLGAAAFVLKPCSNEELGRAVHRVASVCAPECERLGGDGRPGDTLRPRAQPLLATLAWASRRR